MADSLANSLQRRILHALFALSRDTQHISAATLADAVGTTPTRAAATLIALERAGLCDASRARLTMLGLAAAARMGSARGGTPRMRKVPARTLQAIEHEAEPLAALPSSAPPPH
ncbi:MAG TPA: hypothetical protein VK509_24825 [Polyangiales bacterium]|nr:hypothetical protein [Polyangiales bacterium]